MLVCLPRDIGKLKNLESLDVSDNRLKELPDTFSALQSLTVLNLTNNRFDEVPRIIGCIRTLHILSLEGNAINDVPVEVIRLPYLSVLKTRPLAPKSSIEVRSSGTSIDIAEKTARRVIIKHLYKKCKLNVHVKRLLMQVKECSFCNGPYFRVNYTVITNQFYNSRYIPVRHEMCSLHFTSEPTMFYLLYMRPNYQGILPRDSEERLPFSMIFNYHAYGDKFKKYIDEQNEEEGTILSLIYHYKRRCDRD
ncbi:Leucine rich repeat protein [Trachipleistophora hominis]|uniref:Leucine rich repeat protein n=1 Tax=Trachipleistophora hominis TaxID=72359 RepID=L7JT11_TRAHO|nr:Leucine rich repeat protein [Trachipleistophora hominis]